MRLGGGAPHLCDEVARRPPALLLGALGQGGYGRAVVVYAHAVPDGVDPAPPLRSQVLVDHYVAAVVLWEIEVSRERGGLDARRPDDGARR